MKSILVAVLLVLMCTLSIKAQYNEELIMSSEEKTVVRLALLAPGLLLEQQIADNTTLVFSIWTGFTYSYSNINGSSSSSFEIFPNATIEPRFYLTQETRKTLGKRTDHFSGGYLGIPVTIGLTDSRFAVGPLYGFQRTLGERGYWNIGLGIGVSGNDGMNSIGLISEFGLGFILF